MKKYLLTGFLFLMPIVLTLLVVSFLFDLFTNPLVHVVSSLLGKLFLPISDNLALVLSRILSFLLLLLFILLLGALVRWFFGQQLLHAAHKLLDRIPVVKTVYKTSRDLLGAFFATDGQKAFHHPVAIPFPSPPQEGVGFKTGQIAKEFQEKLKEPMVPVFLPTAPHPLSGFLLLIPEKDVQRLDMTNEDAFKWLVSCGTMLPPKGTQ